MNAPNQPTGFDKPVAKSIFTSKTFWGAVLAGIASLVPLGINSIKAQKLTIDDAGQAILILCGVGTAIVGRVDAKAPIYTPEGLPGPNKSDY
ncbi:hypothetical protein [Nostoc sp.]|uniref:hypothetical protein n=1 Tax=Nostoc sp. TaxID=1180 RepID=UPI002FFB93A7